MAARLMREGIRDFQLVSIALALATSMWSNYGRAYIIIVQLPCINSILLSMIDFRLR